MWERGFGLKDTFQEGFLKKYAVKPEDGNKRRHHSGFSSPLPFTEMSFKSICIREQFPISTCNQQSYLNALLYILDISGIITDLTFLTPSIQLSQHKETTVSSTLEVWQQKDKKEKFIIGFKKREKNKAIWNLPVVCLEACF